MKTYPHEAWQRLGRSVGRARKRAGYTETPQWAAAVGRSTRVVLGLERGESVGVDTLARVEELLGWPDDETIRILEDAGSDVATVTPAEIAAARQAHGWTYQQFADAVGDVGPKAIEAWETGAIRVPPSKTPAVRAIISERRREDLAGALSAVSEVALLAELTRRALEREAVEGNGNGTHNVG